MINSENRQSQDYFDKSQKIWFPDFEKVLQEEAEYYDEYSNSSNYSGLIAVLCFFRKEHTRAQFVAYFLEQDPPQKKLLTKHRKLYNRAHELCTAYQNQLISDAEFDKQLLLSFRNRPTDDVFAPAPESWEEITLLISRLEAKSKRLPVYFDGLAWSAYLKGIATNQQYVQVQLARDTGGYLAQLLAYGVDSIKKELKEIYSMEVSVCMRLRKLCIDYKEELISSDDFISQFLLLAREFCSDIVE